MAKAHQRPRTFRITMEAERYAELQRRAQSRGVPTATYARLILVQTLNQPQATTSTAGIP